MARHRSSSSPIGGSPRRTSACGARCSYRSAGSGGGGFSAGPPMQRPDPFGQPGVGLGSALVAAQRLIPAALAVDRSCPLATGDRGDRSRLLQQRVARSAAGVDDGRAVGPGSQAELVLAQVPSGTLDRVPFGAEGGRGKRVGFAGRSRSAAPCHPASSSATTPCATGATWRLISARCRLMAPVLARQHEGSIDRAPSAGPCRLRFAPDDPWLRIMGQTAPNR